jgi:hypothetical protein
MFPTLIVVDYRATEPSNTKLDTSTMIAPQIADPIVDHHRAEFCISTSDCTVPVDVQFTQAVAIRTAMGCNRCVLCNRFSTESQ